MDVIDVFPADGVDPAPCAAAECVDGEGPYASPGSDFTGSLDLVAVDHLTGGAGVEVYYTTAATVTSDPADPGNSTSPATVDPAVVNTTTWTLADDLAQVPADATALRFKKDGSFTAEDAFSYRLIFAGAGNTAGDTYVNTLDSAVVALTSAGEVQTVRRLGPIQSTVSVLDSSIGDYVWSDTDADGIQDPSESGFNNVKVALSGTDDLGNPVNLETTTRRSPTGEHGWYEFAGLRSSDQNGYQLTFTAPSGKVWTSRDAVETSNTTGEETPTDPDTVDSDVDGRGQATVVLAADTALPTVDAGLVTLPGAPMIDLTKAGLLADGATGAVGDTVEWSFTITNTGPVALTGLNLTDDMPESANFAWGQCAASDTTAIGAVSALGDVTLAPQDYLICQATSTIGQPDIDAGLQLNPLATITATSVPPTDVTTGEPLADPTTGDPLAGTKVTDTDTAEVPVTQSPSIEFSKTVDQTEAKVGDVITFTMTGHNTGNTTLYDVTVDDPMSGLVNKECEFPGQTGVLAPGQQVICTAEYTITEADAATGEIVNVAVIQVDPTPTDPTTDPTDPTTEPTDPTTEPTETTSGPNTTEPTSTEPTEPTSTEPSESTPEEPTTSADPTPTESTTPTEPTSQATESATASESVVPQTNPVTPEPSLTPGPTTPAPDEPSSPTSGSPSGQTVVVEIDGPTEASAQAVVKVAPTAQTGGAISGGHGWVALVAGALVFVAVGLVIVRRRLMRL
jgi:uncharacterized repeat protein (TIGR01451 family)